MSNNSVNISPLIFISHDARDEKIAAAFSDLLEKTSTGLLKVFNSSDKRSNKGIEIGADWRQVVMKNLDEASVMVCLLTKNSISKSWIPYEVGVAKGRRNIPVRGLALGIDLVEVNAGPFAHIQNCPQDEKSIVKLVIELITKCLPGSNPPEKVIQTYTREFLDVIAVISQDKPIHPANAAQDTSSDRMNSLRILEEIKGVALDLSASLEDALPQRVMQELITRLDEMKTGMDKFSQFTAEVLTRDKTDSTKLQGEIDELQRTIESKLARIPAISALAKCGILNILEDRPTAEDHIIELLKRAKERIEIVGISLRTLFQGGGKLNRTINDLLTDASESKKEKPSWRILVLDPDCEQARYRSEREEPVGKKMEVGTLHREVTLTIEFVKEWRSKGCNIELRKYHGSPSCFMMLIDNVIFVEQYHYGRAGGARVAELVPILEFSADSTTYKELKGHFEYMWEKLSKPPLGENEVVAAQSGQDKT